MPFLIGDKKGPVAVDTNAIWRLESRWRRSRFFDRPADPQQRPVLRNQCRQRMPRRLGVVKVPLLVGLQAHRELVKVIGDLLVVVKAFVEIDLVVSVEIVQPHELIATSYEDLAVDNLDPQRLKESTGNSLPGQLAGRRQQTPHQKDTSIPRTHGRGVAPFQKIQASQSQPAVPRILFGTHQVVHRQRTLVITANHLRRQYLWPAFRSAMHERLQVRASESA